MPIPTMTHCFIASTLLNWFGSKDELVVAYLKERDRRWRELLEESLDAHDDPREKLTCIFDAYRRCLLVDGLRGCAYVNCAAEFPDPNHPVRAVVREHKDGVRRRLRALAQEAGVEDPDFLAEQLFMLLEGAFVNAAIEADERLMVRACSLAGGLVRAVAG